MINDQVLKETQTNRMNGSREAMHCRIAHTCPIGKVYRNQNWVSQKAHQAGAYLRFLYYEATTSISSPPGWDTSPPQVTSQQFCQVVPKQFAGSHLYTWVERGTARGKCSAKEHNVLQTNE